MNWNALDLNLLRVLDAMLRERSTTRVGERIGLSQPAVSSALNRLREILGDRLFVREGNRMVPTSFAETLEEPLRQALDRIERALSGGAAFDPVRSTRTFRLLGDNFLSEVLLPPLVARLSREAPGIRFQLLSINPRPLAEQFAEGSIDLAFAPGISMPDWVDRVLAFRTTACFVASRNNARLARAGIKDRQTIPLDIFCDMPHVQFSPEGGLTASEDEVLAELGRRRHIVLTVPDFFSVGRVAAQSELIGAVPVALALSVADQLGLSVHKAPFAMRLEHLYLYWHRRQADDPEHRWMRDLILERLEPLDEVRHPPSLGFDRRARKSSGRRNASAGGRTPSGR